MSEAVNGTPTPLYQEHCAADARLVEFAGYILPVQYTSVREEHHAVRNAAGLFDVSHMGEISIRGSRALEFVQNISCNDHSRQAVGRAQYTGIMTPQGTFVDDLLVHKMADDEYLLVVNASNRAKDVAYLHNLASSEPDVVVEDCSEQYAQLALQGPAAASILQPITDQELGTLRYYRFFQATVAGAPALVARTGYTGEDGFEIYCDGQAAPAIWRALTEQGQPLGLKPAGLGARDMLRLEAGMALYGNDIDETVTPLEANLSWIVKLDKPSFLGRKALLEQQQTGLHRRLVGFVMCERGIPRHGYQVVAASDPGAPVGVVTSGTFSWSLDKAIGLAMVPKEMTSPGSELGIMIRDRRARAVVVELPFYSRKKRGKTET